LYIVELRPRWSYDEETFEEEEEEEQEEEEEEMEELVPIDPQVLKRRKLIEDCKV